MSITATRANGPSPAPVFGAVMRPPTPPRASVDVELVLFPRTPLVGDDVLVTVWLLVVLLDEVVVVLDEVLELLCDVVELLFDVVVLVELDELELP